MRGGTVDAHPNYLIATGTKLAVVVAQATGLGSATRGIVLRIKVKHHLLATIVTKQNLFAILVHSQALGSLITDIHTFRVFSL